VIPLTRHLDPNLKALLDQLDVETRPSPTGGALLCHIITITDIGIAQTALAGYHRERWNRRPGAAGPADIRLSDLGELIGALLLYGYDIHRPDTIYPLTFASPGPTAQPAGIDVLGVEIDVGIGSLMPHEYLSIAEAKSTLARNAANAISGVQADVKKCTTERITDSLFVLKWDYELAGDHNHLRLPLFVTANAEFYGSIVIDPLICDIDRTIASIFNRLEGKATPIGAPLVRVFLLCLPNAVAFIEATL
jgi:hypothetical protein